MDKNKKYEYLKKYRKTAKWKTYYKEWLKKNAGYHKEYYQNLKNKAKQYDESKQGNQQD